MMMAVGDNDPRGGGLRLDELARELAGAAGPMEIAGDAGVRVRGVRHDSREVERGELFVARRGAAVDGARFVADAVAREAEDLLGRAEPVRHLQIGCHVRFVGMPPPQASPAVPWLLQRAFANAVIAGLLGSTSTENGSDAALVRLAESVVVAVKVWTPSANGIDVVISK